MHARKSTPCTAHASDLPARISATSCTQHENHLYWPSFSRNATIWSLLHPSTSFLDTPAGAPASTRMHTPRALPPHPLCLRTLRALPLHPTLKAPSLHCHSKKQPIKGQRSKLITGQISNLSQAKEATPSQAKEATSSQAKEATSSQAKEATYHRPKRQPHHRPKKRPITGQRSNLSQAKGP